MNKTFLTTLFLLFIVIGFGFSKENVRSVKKVVSSNVWSKNVLVEQVRNQPSYSNVASERTALASSIRIYSDVDLSEIWGFRVLTVQSNLPQGMGIGVGVEADILEVGSLTATIGGRFQFDRKISAYSVSPLYHFHATYLQLFHKLSDKFGLGCEFNFSVHGGDTTYSAGATLTGANGGALLLHYHFNHDLSVKCGYRAMNGYAGTGTGTYNYSIASYGPFFQIQLGF